MALPKVVFVLGGPGAGKGKKQSNDFHVGLSVYTILNLS